MLCTTGVGGASWQQKQQSEEVHRSRLTRWMTQHHAAVLRVTAGSVALLRHSQQMPTSAVARAAGGSGWSLSSPVHSLHRLFGERLPPRPSPARRSRVFTIWVCRSMNTRRSGVRTSRVLGWRSMSKSFLRLVASSFSLVSICTTAEINQHHTLRLSIESVSNAPHRRLHRCSRNRLSFGAEGGCARAVPSDPPAKCDSE